MGYIQSLLFVIVFELFTLYYLVRGKKAMAGFYSVCYLIMNIFYYYHNFDTMGPEYWTSLFLSFIIPFSIYNVADNIPKEMEFIEKQKEYTDIESIVNEKLAPLKSDIEEIKFKNEWNKAISSNEPIRTRKNKQGEE
jgi:hypothetical protein